MEEVVRVTAQLLSNKYLLKPFNGKMVTWESELLCQVYRRMLRVYDDNYGRGDQGQETVNRSLAKTHRYLRLLGLDYLAPTLRDLTEKSRALRIVSAIDDKVCGRYTEQQAARRARLIIIEDQKKKCSKEKKSMKEASNIESVAPGPASSVDKPARPKAYVVPTVRKVPSLASSPQSPEFTIPTGRQLPRTPVNSECTQNPELLSSSDETESPAVNAVIAGSDKTEAPASVRPLPKKPTVDTIEKPSLKKPTVDTIEKPSLKKPTVDTIEKPSLKKPTVDTIEKPSLKKPTVDTIEKPSLKKPTVDTIEKPSLKKPTVDTIEKPPLKKPTVDTIEKPSLKKPTVDTIEKPSLKKPTVDTIEKPSLKKPTVDTIEKPSLKKPTVDTIEKPSLKKPTVDNNKKQSPKKCTVGSSKKPSPRKNTMDTNKRSSPGSPVTNDIPTGHQIPRTPKGVETVCQGQDDGSLMLLGVRNICNDSEGSRVQEHGPLVSGALQTVAEGIELGHFESVVMSKVDHNFTSKKQNCELLSNVYKLPVTLHTVNTISSPAKSCGCNLGTPVMHCYQLPEALSSQGLDSSPINATNIVDTAKANSTNIPVVNAKNCKNISVDVQPSSSKEPEKFENSRKAKLLTVGMWLMQEDNFEISGIRKSLEDNVENGHTQARSSPEPGDLTTCINGTPSVTQLSPSAGLGIPLVCSDYVAISDDLCIISPPVEYKGEVDQPGVIVENLSIAAHDESSDAQTTLLDTESQISKVNVGFLIDAEDNVSCQMSVGSESIYTGEEPDSGHSRVECSLEGSYLSENEMINKRTVTKNIITQKIEAMNTFKTENCGNAEYTKENVHKEKLRNKMRNEEKTSKIILDSPIQHISKDQVRTFPEFKRAKQSKHETVLNLPQLLESPSQEMCHNDLEISRTFTEGAKCKPNENVKEKILENRMKAQEEKQDTSTGIDQEGQGMSTSSETSSRFDMDDSWEIFGSYRADKKEKNTLNKGRKNNKDGDILMEKTESKKKVECNKGEGKTKARHIGKKKVESKVYIDENIKVEEVKQKVIRRKVGETCNNTKKDEDAKTEKVKHKEKVRGRKKVDDIYSNTQELQEEGVAKVIEASDKIQTPNPSEKGQVRRGRGKKREKTEDPEKENRVDKDTDGASRKSKAGNGGRRMLEISGDNINVNSEVAGNSQASEKKITNGKKKAVSNIQQRLVQDHRPLTTDGHYLQTNDDKRKSLKDEICAGGRILRKRHTGTAKYLLDACSESPVLKSQVLVEISNITSTSENVPDGGGDESKIKSVKSKKAQKTSPFSRPTKRKAKVEMDDQVLRNLECTANVTKSSFSESPAKSRHVSAVQSEDVDLCLLNPQVSEELKPKSTFVIPNTVPKKRGGKKKTDAEQPEERVHRSAKHSSSTPSEHTELEVDGNFSWCLSPIINIPRRAGRKKVADPEEVDSQILPKGKEKVRVKKTMTRIMPQEDRKEESNLTLLSEKKVEEQTEKCGDREDQEKVFSSKVDEETEGNVVKVKTKEKKSKKVTSGSTAKLTGTAKANEKHKKICYDSGKADKTVNKQSEVKRSNASKKGNGADVKAVRRHKVSISRLTADKSEMEGGVAATDETRQDESRADTDGLNSSLAKPRGRHCKSKAMEAISKILNQS